MKSHLVLLATLFLPFALNAQEYKPYPEAQISQEQWSAYFNEVSQKHKATRSEVLSEQLVTFEDRSTSTMYAFTLTAHPAHPAWVTRQVYEEGGMVKIRQIGYFVGNEASFAKLFRAYKALNDRVLEGFRQKSQ